MGQIRKHYTPEFKLEALRLAETSGKPDSELERDLGLSKGCLGHWRQARQRNGKNAFPGKGHLTEADERLRQLERENAILRQEREILKKAIGVISPKQP
ncbi:MAG: transposase [Chloroflexi bacterium]|nr:transposase [Chloroflexota bacterium]